MRPQVSEIVFDMIYHTQLFKILRCQDYVILPGAQALRVLDNVMDTVIDQPVNPPPAWELLERCVSPRPCSRALSRQSPVHMAHMVLIY